MLFSGFLFVFLIHVAILDFFFETSKYFATFSQKIALRFGTCRTCKNDYFDQESSEYIFHPIVGCQPLFRHSKSKSTSSR